MRHTIYRLKLIWAKVTRRKISTLSGLQTESKRGKSKILSVNKFRVNLKLPLKWIRRIKMANKKIEWMDFNNDNKMIYQH